MDNRPLVNPDDPTQSLEDFIAERRANMRRFYRDAGIGSVVIVVIILISVLASH